MDPIIVVSIFVVCLFLTETCRHVYLRLRRPELRAVRKRLKRLPVTAYEQRPIEIVRRRVYSDVPWLSGILSHTPGATELDDLLKRANVDATVGFLLFLSILLALTAFFAWTSLLGAGKLMSILVGLVFGYLPLGFLLMKEKKRMAKLESQLPDALELIARTLRAGQAFAGGLTIAADEFDDPIGTEFDRTLEEINFGLGVPEALRNLAARVDCPDVRFFVIAVIIQHESGGNLAEIVESIAHIVRERFKLMGKVKVLTAEGKYSAVILCLLPFIIGLSVFILNRHYIMLLVGDPIGRFMIGAGLLLMFFGLVVMRKMIQIKV